ncbi:MAG: carcinine hydrolase/isopenicillin-N N-acyltransferase family protein [Candidatus Eisenbacteria bacterium]
MNSARSCMLFGLPILASVAVLSASGSSEACSVFALSAENEVVYGQNLDWRTPVPGQVVVNKRGVEKTVLPWKGDWPAPSASETARWISRYGSVTFTCYGRDFIEGGMNEAGLIVDETSLTAVYPPDDGRPGVSCPQWMQYQLDCFATVGEVVAHLDDLRPDGEGWHYLIADASGECAVIEYLDGEPTVFSGEAAEVCALTNTTYRQALGHIPLDAAFGGEIDIAAGSDSYGRFVRIAALLRDYDPERDGRAIDHAFRILDDVSSTQTRRSVVYDATRGRVLWTTRGNAGVRRLELGSLDFSLGTPVQVLDVEAGGTGDVSALLTDYTLSGNRAVVTAVLDSGERSPEGIEELAKRGLTFDEALDLIARHATAAAP